MSRCFRIGPGPLLVASLAACGGETTDPSNPAAAVRTVAEAPAAGDAAQASALTAGGTVDRVGVTAEGHLVAVVDGLAHELWRGALDPRRLFAEDGAPEGFGAVRAVGPRMEGGAWFAAEAGLFSLDGHYVTRSPLMPSSAGALSVAEVAAGPMAGLWLGTEDGLFLRSEAGLERLDGPGLDGAVRAVAVEAGGRFGAVASGEALALLEADGDALTTLAPPLETGAIHGLAAGDGALWAAAEQGLFRYRPDDEPAWTRFTLSAEGDGPRPALAVTTDPATGAVWARTEAALIHVAGDALTEHAAPTPTGGTAGVAVDNLGDVYTPAGEGLSVLETGAGRGDAVTFTEDVVPWVQARCSMCHMNQTANFEDYEVFAEVAEDALSRVRSGDMPRCDGGRRCAPDDQLAPEDYAVLEQWIRGGLPE